VCSSSPQLIKINVEVHLRDAEKAGGWGFVIRDEAGAGSIRGRQTIFFIFWLFLKTIFKKWRLQFFL
jgi:hypothetical protein